MNYCGNIVGLNIQKERRICGELNKHTQRVVNFNSCNKPTYPISSFHAIQAAAAVVTNIFNVMYCKMCVNEKQTERVILHLWLARQR